MRKNTPQTDGPPPHGAFAGFTGRHWTALGLLLVLFLLVRYACVDLQIQWISHNLFPDEAFTHRVVQGTLRESLDLTLNDVHPPLYYIVIWLLKQPLLGWESLWFPSEQAESLYQGIPQVRLYRLLNFLFLPPAFLLIALLAQWLWPENRHYLWVVLALLILLPFGNYWDTTARHYPLMNLQTLAALACLVAYLRTGRPGFLGGYMLSGLLSFYTHYFAYPYIVVFGVSGFLLGAQKRRCVHVVAATAGAILLSVLVDFALFSPVGHQLVHLSAPPGTQGHRAQHQFYDNPWQAPVLALSTIGAMLVEVRSGYAIEWYNYPVAFAWLQLLLIVAAVGLGFRFMRGGPWQPVAFLLWTAIGPIWLVDTYKLYAGSWLPRMARHYYCSYPLVLLLLAMGLVEFFCRFRQRQRENRLGDRAV